MQQETEKSFLKVYISLQNSNCIMYCEVIVMLLHGGSCKPLDKCELGKVAIIGNEYNGMIQFALIFNQKITTKQGSLIIIIRIYNICIAPYNTIL